MPKAGPSGTEAATAEAVPDALSTAGLTVVDGPDRYPAGPAGARTGSMLYVAVAVDGQTTGGQLAAKDSAFRCRVTFGRTASPNH